MSHGSIEGRRRSVRRRWATGLVVAVVGVLCAVGPGAAWGGSVKLTDDFPMAWLDDNDGIATTGTAVHALFSLDDWDGEPALGYAKSGLTFGARGDILDERCDVAEGIAVDGSLVVTLCSLERLWDGRERRLMLRRSVDGEWKPPLELQGPTNPSGQGVSVAVSGQLVVVAWTERGGAIRLRRSTNGGATFRPIVRLGTTDTTEWNPSFRGQHNGSVQVAIQGDQVLVAWYRGSVRSGSTRWPKGIVLRRSTDRGASFGATRTLTDGTQARGAMALTATDAAVLLLHTTGQRQLRLLRSTDGGRTFASQALTPEKQSDAQVDIAAVGTDVRAIWRQHTKVYLRRSDDSGQTWAAREWTGVGRREDIAINPNVGLVGVKTVVGWNAADPAWEDLGGAWVAATSSD